MADVGGADGSDDEQDQDQETATLDMEIGGETKTASHLLGLPPGLPLHCPQLL